MARHIGRGENHVRADLLLDFEVPFQDLRHRSVVLLVVDALPVQSGWANGPDKGCIGAQIALIGGVSVRSKNSNGRSTGSVVTEAAIEGECISDAGGVSVVAPGVTIEPDAPTNDGLGTVTVGKSDTGQPGVPAWRLQAVTSIRFCCGVPHGAFGAIGWIRHGRIEGEHIPLYFVPSGHALPADPYIQCQVWTKLDVILHKKLWTLQASTPLGCLLGIPSVRIPQQEVSKHHARCAIACRRCCISAGELKLPGDLVTPCS